MSSPRARRRRRTPRAARRLKPGGGDQAMTQHRRLHQFRIGRTAGDQRRHFPEISWAEHPRGENDQTGRRFLSIVAEAVNDPALYEDGSPRLELDVAAVDAPRAHAGETVNRFVPILMKMRDGHASARLHDHLEQIQAALAAFLGLKKPQLQAADAYDLQRHAASSSTLGPPQSAFAQSLAPSTRTRQHLIDLSEQLPSP